MSTWRRDANDSNIIATFRLKISNEKSRPRNFSHEIENTQHLHQSARSQENLTDGEMIAEKDEMREITRESSVYTRCFFGPRRTRDTRKRFSFRSVARDALENCINSEKIVRQRETV